MTIYTIGFTQKSAEQFFELLKANRIELLIDIRLNNKSQLAGFTKGTDLSYFLKEICGTKYIHCNEYAPNKELLSNYQKGNITWDEYEIEFNQIMENRKCCTNFMKRFEGFERVCLLCSEPTPEHCHRRLVAEKICSTTSGNVIIHL